MGEAGRESLARPMALKLRSQDSRASSSLGVVDFDMNWLALT